MYCNEFAKTGIKLKKHKAEEECRICPLHNSKGVCIVDIGGDKGQKMSKELSAEISEIWRKFYEAKK